MAIEFTEEQKKMMQSMHNVYIDGLRKQLQLDETWRYERIPLMENSDWDDFMTICGEENVVLVSGHNKKSRTGEDCFTGSIFLSAEAITNLENYWKTLK